MKALITAGGHGTRLRPITYTLNKHLIPLANKPLLFYALEKIAETGIKEVFINVNPGEKELPKVVGNGKRWGLKIKYFEQTGGPKGLAHVVKVARPYLKNEPFVFYLGDNLVLGSIKPLVKKFLKEKYNAFITLSKVKDPERFGVPEIKRGRIIKVEEKPKRPKSNFAVTGIYIYQPIVFKILPQLKPSWRGELEISDLHSKMISKGYRIGYEEITGWWKDTGKAEDLLEGNALILENIKNNIQGKLGPRVVVEGKVQIGKGTRISGKTLIRGPVIIGNFSKIKDSYIGPYNSIGNNVEIQSTEIEHSIILNKAKINSFKRKIVDSIIGEEAVVTSAFQTLPSGHKLIIGNNSQVEL